jgi:hypothetical protein
MKPGTVRQAVKIVEAHQEYLWEKWEELFMASKTTPRNDEKKIRQRIKSAN